MIARTWHGCVPCEKGDAFALHLEKTGVEHARRIPGNCGAFVKRMAHRGYEHFFLATYWESLDAVRAFAGEEYDLAVHYPGDEAFCLIADPYVFHHAVGKIQPL